VPALPEADARALARAARGGVCVGCAHAALVRSASGSIFLRCRHGTPPKYPPMPVIRCASRLPLPTG
jgi:hypothetical protein